MKLFTASAIALLCGTSLAFAAENPSGRPGQVLDDAQCQKAWEMAAPDGDTLSKEKATPFILNFQMVDTSKDAMISQDEWKKGCNKGWISADANTARDMKNNSGSGSMNKSGGDKGASGSSTY